MSRVYLDNAATTPISEVALQAFIEQSRQLGNPSSLHTYGRKVRKDVEEAREKLAGLIGCHSSEIIFTGSGTEANNLAIKGAYWHRNQGGKQRNVIVISAFEHHAVLGNNEMSLSSPPLNIMQSLIQRVGWKILKVQN